MPSSRIEPKKRQRVSASSLLPTYLDDLRQPYTLARDKSTTVNHDHVHGSFNPITPKILCLELWSLCTALLLNEIFLPMKFHVDALHSFSWIRDILSGDNLT